MNNSSYLVSFQDSYWFIIIYLHVGSGSNESATNTLSFLQFFAYAEICDFYLTLSVNEYVFGFNIPMNLMFFYVEVFDPLKYLLYT